MWLTVTARFEFENVKFMHLHADTHFLYSVRIRIFFWKVFYRWWVFFCILRGFNYSFKEKDVKPRYGFRKNFIVCSLISIFSVDKNRVQTF